VREKRGGGVDRKREVLLLGKGKGIFRERERKILALEEGTSHEPKEANSRRKKSPARKISRPFKEGENPSRRRLKGNIRPVL